MAKEHILLIFFLSILILQRISASEDSCRPASCGPSEPTIQFPFRLTDQQPPYCGLSGFVLSCNKQNRTIIKLPSWRSHIVNRIDYFSQVIYIGSDFCSPNGIKSFSLTNTPFDKISIMRSYTFYNCSLHSFGFIYSMLPFPCLSNGNYSVIAVETGLSLPRNMTSSLPRNMTSSCKVMRTFLEVPDGDIRSELQLVWRLVPSTRDCELGDGGCSSGGTSPGAKLGLSLGLGAVCLIGLVCYVAFRARVQNQETPHRGIDSFSIAIIALPPLRTGLDGPTIESYPKTMLGESGRLPNDDNNCAICLEDFKPKELLRTIPECNHYFHVDCIDEWLKLNATCPVCRNSPESSSLQHCVLQPQ